MRSTYSLSLLLLTAVDLSWAIPRSNNGPAARPHSLNGPAGRRRTTSTCASGADLTITAPKKNIFAGLSDQDFADITSFLHAQDALNLTAVANSTA